MAINLRRKAYDKLLKWKEESAGSSAILINGARRVGKSHLAQEFAEMEYKAHVLIDFSDDENEIAGFFREGKWKSKDFLEYIEVASGKVLPERDTVIIFDEVQLCPEARQMIKHLVSDGRYDYIETGSLLSIKENVKNMVIPSEEDDLDLYPLDFEEFLWAMGNETAIPYLKECLDGLKPVGDDIHRKMMGLFRKYMLVGGMPQAVIKYIETESFEEVERVKRRILRTYRKDISKHAGAYKQRVNAVFDEIPAQLSKKEKKFMITSVDKDARNREYEDAFMWLADAMMVNRCVNSTDPSVGLSMNMDLSTQKLYMSDTGLLVTQCLDDEELTGEDIYKSLLLGKIGINEGMFAENIVAQCFVSSGRHLFFYSRPAEKGGDVVRKRLKVDFLIRRNRAICPVEVKSSERLTHASLDEFVRRFGKRVGQPYLLCIKDLHEKDGVVYLPLYMAAIL